jgi:multiple sugar transport system permease protein
MATNSRDLFGARRKWILYLILVGVCFYFVAPLLWMLITSLKDNSQVFHDPPILIPNPVRWVNFVVAMVKGNFSRYLLNTIFLSCAVILGTLISCSIVAYGFSRVEWKGRDLVFMLVISTMLIPEHVTLVPLFVVFKKLGLVSGGFKGYLPLILPAWFARPFFIFMIRQFFMGIPKELSDAARIDGCSEFGILWRIILPLSKPAMIAVALFSLIGTWNDFLGPLVYIQDEKFFTLSIGLATFQGKYITQWNQVMAASTMMVLPILLVFLVAQKQFVQGISLTGLK